MKLLSVECSATPCSVAISENGKILASAFSNVKLTHSQTLMPMVESVLKSSLIDIKEIDAFAVSNGPGSFTGVRIGISAIKGMQDAIRYITVFLVVRRVKSPVFAKTGQWRLMI